MGETCCVCHLDCGVECVLILTGNRFAHFWCFPEAFGQGHAIDFESDATNEENPPEIGWWRQLFRVLVLDVSDMRYLEGLCAKLRKVVVEKAVEGVREYVDFYDLHDAYADHLASLPCVKARVRGVERLRAVHGQFSLWFQRHIASMDRAVLSFNELSSIWDDMLEEVKEIIRVLVLKKDERDVTKDV